MSAIARRRDVWASGELSDGYRHGEVPENGPRNFDRDAGRSFELPICSGLFQPRLLSDLQHPARMVCQGCLGERTRPQNKSRNPARHRRQKAARGRRLDQLEHEPQVSLRNLRTLDCVRKTGIHHQNSGVPEFWYFEWTQIGNIRFAVVKPEGRLFS
jgi:hypothetical protein